MRSSAFDEAGNENWSAVIDEYGLSGRMARIDELFSDWFDDPFFDSWNRSEDRVDAQPYDRT